MELTFGGWVGILYFYCCRLFLLTRFIFTIFFLLVIFIINLTYLILSWFRCHRVSRIAYWIIIFYFFIWWTLLILIFFHKTFPFYKLLFIFNNRICYFFFFYHIHRLIIFIILTISFSKNGAVSIKIHDKILSIHFRVNTIPLTLIVIHNYMALLLFISS